MRESAHDAEVVDLRTEESAGADGDQTPRPEDLRQPAQLIGHAGFDGTPAGDDPWALGIVEQAARLGDEPRGEGATRRGCGEELDRGLGHR